MRKRKIKFSTLVDLISYYDFYRCELNGTRGTLYKTDKITLKAREILESYNNVRIYKGNTEYAPEIKFYGVFVGDKCFK